MNLDAPAVTALKKANTPATFLEWMSRHLDWPIGLDDFQTLDNFLYDFSAADLGIKSEEFAKIRSFRQLPPLDDNQPWGIFLVEFDTRRFSVTALRKILSRLVPTSRNSLFHPVWNTRDLLFLCFWGTGNDRTVCLARFAEEAEGLASVRTVHCAPAVEDSVHLSRFATRLEPLRWPASGTSAEDWCQAWDQAFGTRWRAVITSSEVLADEMATLAIEIHNRVLDALRVETDEGFAHRLFAKVKSTLLHDVSESQFADMYAQTIVYGLFSARCLDPTPDTFSVKEAISLIPNTNPFLKGLMKDCFADRQRGGLSLDELGIGDVVDLFANVDAARIAADFGRRTGQGREDPVIYFYEEFLKRYDSAQKIACGEFYTPQPVVAFMVRAVDTLLKTRFNLPDGLATAGDRTIRRRIGASDKTRPEKVPAVQILDPATGTGTFLRQIILSIHASFVHNFRKTHPAAIPSKLSKAWSDYVDDHLLPRLNGFELMMAPYAIAHMKLAMVLQDTGYDFGGNGRLRVFLTNSLEEPGNANPQLALWNDPLAIESIEANAVKKNPAINVVIGNPPYSSSSSNRGQWILTLLQDYKNGLNERHLNLDDDYIKFIRLGHEIISRSGSGILAFISNNSFLDGVTHRQMRKMLMEDFNDIFIFDLHGNARKKETCPDGAPDKNVFDIMQGVSINFFVKTGEKGPCRVHHADCYGLREEKFEFLSSHDFPSVKWVNLSCTSPLYFFVPKDLSVEGEYNNGFGIGELLEINNSGIKTDRDSLFIDIEKTQLVKRIKTLLGGRFSDEFAQTYRVVDSSSYKLTAKIQGKRYRDEFLQKLLYHPFDLFWIYYDPTIISRPAYGAMQHLLERNLALCCKRGFDDTDAAPIFCVDTLFCMRGWSRPGSNGAEFIFPLYLYQEWHGKIQKVPNLNQEIIRRIEAVIGKTTPKRIFGYIYAVLHSQSYREKYKEFLKIDFPRIPYPTDANKFHVLAELGAKLIAIHTMKDFPEAQDVTFEGSGGQEVTQAKWHDGAVWINRESGFAGVDEVTWLQWIGGYQPLQKWLKDRKGRDLSPADISHYKRMVQALRRTRELMAEIDALPLPWTVKEGE